MIPTGIDHQSLYVDDLQLKMITGSAVVSLPSLGRIPSIPGRLSPFSRFQLHSEHGPNRSRPARSLENKIEHITACFILYPIFRPDARQSVDKIGNYYHYSTRWGSPTGRRPLPENVHYLNIPELSTLEEGPPINGLVRMLW
jgi:hypothetical protein